QKATPGTTILLAPGTYRGGLSHAGLQGTPEQPIVIAAADPERPPVIQGGGGGLHFTDPAHLELRGLTIDGASGNGLNIDDGGPDATPSTDITLRNIVVRDIVTPGNHDGIKLSGVDRFLIEGVQVRNWGTSGSAVDMVGCHHGLIQNSLFAHTNTANEGTTLQPKGGSKDITFRANRIELPPDAGRAVQAGGSTGAAFFRFIDGDSNYEADEITAEGNVIIGGSSAFSWVNIDGGVFHHNFVHRPFRWVARILNENQGNAIVDTRNGQLHDNRIVYNDTSSELSTAVNVGAETLPDTYSFERNRWLNLANPTPAGSTPSLPTTEQRGIYGDQSLNGQLDHAIVWDFAWGKWIVNANTGPESIDIPNFAALRRVSPGEGARFQPPQADPLEGMWTSAAIPSATIELPAFSQVILIDPVACPNCLGATGDYDGNGIVDGLDYDVWRAAFGDASGLADGNGDGLVNAADFVVWRAAFVNSNSANAAAISALVPEPLSSAIGALAFAVPIVTRLR
ncbi:MAG TPA: hypothetical protein VJ828_09325, partial [Lacipirellulaceae bacterium]|nr:hypothetical protein [Lacipirellulaceae bacterium]